MSTYGAVTLSDGRQGELHDVFTSAVTGKQLAIVQIDGKPTVVSMEVVQ